MKENIIEKLRAYDTDDLLSALGIETRTRWADVAAPLLGAFGVGLLVGAGIGLMFAQRPGRELREDLRQRIAKAPEAFASALPGARERTAESVPGTHGPSM